VSTSVVKWSEGVRKRMSIINKIPIDNMKFAAYLFVSFIIFFHVFSVMFCVIVYMVVGINLYKYILCVIIVTYFLSWVFFFIVLFCVLHVCKCVL